MTGKKQAFINAYLEDIKRNRTAAAIAAGYSPKTAKQAAYKLMNDAEVKKAIDEAEKERHEQNTAKADEVIEFLTSVIRGDETEAVPLSVGKGKQKLFESKAAVRDRIKAAELLGKYYDIFDGNNNKAADTGGVIVIPEIKEGADNE